MAMTMVADGSTKDRLNWPVLLAFWAFACAFLIARAVLGSGHVPLFDDTDDAMRLVVVRDFLAGQDWYDHLQYRLNTPFGAEIHWSRLIDVPIAGLILLFTPFAGTLAETLTAYVWPLLLLLVLLWLSATITTRLVGREGLLPALALPVLSPAVISEFSPGRLDHHSVQILLTLVLVWCSIEALRRPRWAIGAGIAAASALAIGTEALPAVATAVAVFGLLWVVQPERADALRGFGLSFSGAALIHLIIALPPSRWFAPACDALSIVYVAAALAVGLAFGLLSMLPAGNRPLLVRLLLAGIAGAAVLAGIVALYPQCLSGPYAALDPWLVANWLDRIAEAKPLWESLRSAPNFAIGFGLPPILGLLVLAWLVWRGERSRRAAWLVLGAYLAVAVLVMLVQVRGARLAMPLAIPAAAWLIAAARARYLGGGGLRAAPGLIGSWIAFAGIALLLLVNAATVALAGLSPAPNAAPEPVPADSEPCLMPAAFTDLAALRPERVMTPVDLGSHLLLFTPHSVVAAPYHRNQQGVRDAFDFFNQPIEEARDILGRRGVTLVVICPAMAETMDLRQAADDSFVRLYARSALPDWLDDVSLPGAPLRVFNVLPRSGP